MKIGMRGLFGSALLALTIMPAAAQFDVEQVRLIQETAKTICDSVQSISGSMSTVAAEGEISAEIQGLFSQIADAGANGKASYTKEEYQGLSRDATAVALEKDQGCRERIFELMFEKLTSAPTVKESYEQGGRRDDLRKIQDFLTYAGVTTARLIDEAVCNGIDSDQTTQELRFADGGVTVVNWERTSSERCLDGYQAVRETTSRCKAAMVDLDDAVRIWSPPRFRISCLSGNCFTCDTTGQWKSRDNPEWSPSSEVIPSDSVWIYTGSSAQDVYAITDEIIEVAKALARVISGGSDKAFCDVSPHFCT
ncbi:MAG: hypothetical protein WBA73_16150 [Devosia sp.]